MLNNLKILIVFIIVFYSKSYANYSADSSYTKLDFNYILPINKQVNDTLYFKNIPAENINYPEEDFITKYGSIIGSILGALFAGLIAIFSVWKTNKNNLKLEIKKYNTQKMIAENKYCGILFSIYSEMIAHDKIYENVISEIEQFLNFFRENITIPVDKPFSEFPMEFLKICRNKILDFSKFETESLALISHYINVLDSVQNDLNLRRIREYLDFSSITDKDLLINGLELYFKQILETLKKLENVREEIKKKVPEIIKSYPQSEVNFGELSNMIKDNK